MSSRRIVLFAAIWFVLASTGLRGRAQEPTSSSGSSSAPNPAPQSLSAPKHPPVKVWTNDDLPASHDARSTSADSSSATNKINGPTHTQADGSKARPRESAWYSRQLAPLRAEAERLDAKIQKTKEFLAGENVSEGQPFHHTAPVSAADQLKQLESQRKANQAKIDDLLDQARHDGILPGALR